METYTYGRKTTIYLKEPALGKGGEGCVYEVDGCPNMVAKIYHEISLAKPHEDKVKEMVRISTTEAFRKSGLLNDIAWPTQPLFNREGIFIGFLMGKAHSFIELDALYEFPESEIHISLKDKITCLINLCSVVDRLHGIGQIVGDFNPNNIKVNPDFSITLVDADSFQITDEKGKEHRCVVCYPGYAAPEVLNNCDGYTYENCPLKTFTADSDSYSLAVHIFRMLMNGSHPYTCELAGNADLPPKTMDQRVKAGETPFFSYVRHYKAPGFAPDIKSFPEYIIDAFRRAFVKGQKDPSVRPDAAEWMRLLASYNRELKQCHNNKNHYYSNQMISCPYCAAEKRYQAKRNMAGTMNPGRKVSSGKTSSSSTRASGRTARTTMSGISGKGQKRQKNRHTVQRSAKRVSISALKGRLGQMKQAFRMRRFKNTGGLGLKYWIWTLIISFILQSVIVRFISPNICAALFGDTVLAKAGIIGGAFAGMAGCVFWNWRGRSRKFSKWRYVASGIIGIVSNSAFILLELALCIVLMFIISILCTILSVVFLVLSFVLMIFIMFWLLKKLIFW